MLRCFGRQQQAVLGEVMPTAEAPLERSNRSHRTPAITGRESCSVQLGEEAESVVAAGEKQQGHRRASLLRTWQRAAFAWPYLRPHKCQQPASGSASGCVTPTVSVVVAAGDRSISQTMSHSAPPCFSSPSLTTLPISSPSFTAHTGSRVFSRRGRCARTGVSHLGSQTTPQSPSRHH